MSDKSKTTKRKQVEQIAKRSVRLFKFLIKFSDEYQGGRTVKCEEHYQKAKKIVELAKKAKL